MAGVNIIQAPKTRADYWSEAIGKAASNFMTGYTKRLEGEQLAEGLDFNQPSGYYQLGRRFLEMGDWDRAYKAWERGEDLEATLAKAAGNVARDYNLQLMRTEGGQEYYSDPRQPGIFFDMSGKQIGKPEGRSVKVGTGAEEGAVASKAEAKEISKVIKDYASAANIEIESSPLLIDKIQTEMRRTGKSATEVMGELVQSGTLEDTGSPWYTFGMGDSVYKYSQTAPTQAAPTQPQGAPTAYDAFRNRGK